MARPELTAKGLWVAALAGCLALAWASMHVQPPSTPAPVSTPAPQVATTPRAPGPARVWKDPSIDPALLERAYAPPSRPLPPAARPKPSRIHPSETKSKRLQRQIDRGELIVY